MSIPSFHNISLKSIMDDLHKIKVTVVVPSVALYNDAEIDTHNEPTKFVDGVAVKHKAFMGNSVAYTGNPTNIVDGEINNVSINNRSTVRLPLSVVIDFFHRSISVYLPKYNNDMLLIIEKLNDILDRLEESPDPNTRSIYDYIESFYETIVKNKKGTIHNKMKDVISAPKGLQTTVGFDDGLLDDSVNKANFINIDDILV